MNAAFDMPGRAAHIRTMIAENETAAAVRGLLDLVREFRCPEHIDEATVISMTFRQLDTRLRRITGAEYTEVQNEYIKQAFKLLDLLRVVEGNFHGDMQ
jgi:hypothetical protein